MVTGATPATAAAPSPPLLLLATAVCTQPVGGSNVSKLHGAGILKVQPLYALLGRNGGSRSSTRSPHAIHNGRAGSKCWVCGDLHHAHWEENEDSDDVDMDNTSGDEMGGGGGLGFRLWDRIRA